jgi:hypothetical protein
MLARPLFRHIPLRAPLAILKHSVSSKATVPLKSVTLSLVIPPSLNPELYNFESVEDIEEIFKEAFFKGPSLYNPGCYDIIPPHRFATLSPSVTYEILWPGWAAGYQGESFRHAEVRDKVFEDKSRLALIASMERQGLKFRELDRIINGPVNTVAEWAGVLMSFLIDSIFLPANIPSARYICPLLFCTNS